MAVLLPDGDVQEHSPPATLGPRVLGTSLAAVPVPGRLTKGWLRDRCRVLPQRLKSVNEYCYTIHVSWLVMMGY